jgi:hypothetical protein
MHIFTVKDSGYKKANMKPSLAQLVWKISMAVVLIKMVQQELRLSNSLCHVS